MITTRRNTLLARAAELWGRVSRRPDGSRSLARPVLLLSALVVVMSLAFAGTASAQTAFQADVSATVPLPAPCSNGAGLCGTANIAGYGVASWNWSLTDLTLVQTHCGSTYTATADFTLASDGSVLVLTESGYVCGPGKDAAGDFNEGPKAFGHPNYPHGTWAVDTAESTGQFAGLRGSGTDDLQAAGAHVAGNYTGTLG